MLQPGDHLQLLPGEYKNGLPIHFLQGQEGAPIIISGPKDKPRAVLRGRQGHNTVSIINSNYVTIRDLEIDGQRLPVDGVKCEGHADWAHHITLENLLIRRHDHNQQIVAISTKCPAWNWTIRKNVIQGAGTGLYLGNSDGSAPFIAGLIEHNLVTKTLGYNLQIKHQQQRPDMPGMPQYDQVTIIRHNVFSKSSHNSESVLARPNVLVGHWPLTGVGQNDQYLIYGNFFYQNPYEALFQGEGNIALYNNLFINHQGDAIRIQPHHNIPRKVDIFFNTILAKGTGIYHAGHNKPALPSPWISNNLIFAQHSLIAPINGGRNISGGYQAASDYFPAPFLPLGKMSLVPLPKKLPYSKINVAQVQHYVEWDSDFAGYLNDSRFGAYAYNAQLKWSPKLEIKPDSNHDIQDKYP